MPNTVVWILILLVMAAVSFIVGVKYRKSVAEREIGSAEDEAKRIINEAIKSAESKKREALVEAKEEIHKSRSEFERLLCISSFASRRASLFLLSALFIDSLIIRFASSSALAISRSATFLR